MNSPKIRITKGPEINWIAEYRGTNNFLLSLQAQSEREGLSPNQISRVRENMQQEQPMFQALQGHMSEREWCRQQQFSFQPGDQVEIKHFIAKRIAEENKVPHAFRNLEIVEIFRESAKAIQVRIKYVSKIATSCHLCGQPLDTEISRACGIGPVCAEKLGFKRPKLADAALILAELEKLAQQIGVLGPVWLAKSQIVDTAHQGPVNQAEDEDEFKMDRIHAEHEQRQEQEAFRRKEEERNRLSNSKN